MAWFQSAEPFPGPRRARCRLVRLREVPVGTRRRAARGGRPGQRRLLERRPPGLRLGIVKPPGKSATYYRTGDVVRRPGHTGPLCYLGRTDSQIKVLGHRVELLEIEAALRDASGSDAVAAIGWPRTPSGAASVVAYIGAEDVDGRRIRSALTASFPSYMVPREVRAMPQLPLNVTERSIGEHWRRSLRTGDSVSAQDVRAVLLGELSESLAAVGLDAGSVPDDFDLLVEGVIDSFGILELVSALEAGYETTLDFSELPASDLTVVGPLSEHIAAQIRATEG